MPSTWATPAAMEHARQALAERYPGASIKIVDTFDLANVAWEADSQGALVLIDDIIEIVIVDGHGGNSAVPALFQVEDKLIEYAELMGTIRAVLFRYKDAGGLQGQELIDAHAQQKWG